MSADRAWETFYNAIRVALVSNTPLQERSETLISAVSHLQRADFTDEHVWDEFRKLVNGSTKRCLGEGRIPDTAQISPEEARERLQTAFNIFSHVAKAFGRTEFVI